MKRMPGRVTIAAMCRALGALVVVLSAGPAHAQGYAPFATFAGLDTAEAGSVQVRIVPLAPDRGLPGILLTVSGGDPDTSVFAGYMRPGFSTLWVEPRSVRAEIATGSMLDALAAVGRMPEATGGTVDSMGAVMLTIVRGRGDSLRVYETSLARETAAALGRSLAPEFRAHARLWDALATLACGCAVATGPPARDVGRALGITLDRFSYDPTHRQLSARLTVRNRSRAPVPGPIEVVVRPEAESIRVLEPDGFICRVYDRVTPFVRLPVDSVLAPGANVERDIHFANPLQVSARFEMKAFTGGGER